jgi:exodeoxyribonuclease V gamma subunit
MSMQIHRSERADRLAGALGDLLSSPLADPFATEIVSVPTPGVERWLSQTLSHRLGTSPGSGDGVCAGVDFPSPRRLIGAAVGAATQIDPATDPWQPRQLVWPLLAVIDRARGQDWAALLWAYLGSHQDQTAQRSAPERRWSTARHLADLFTSYAVSRPALIQHWLHGRDLDARGRPLSSDRVWQAELWRRLRAELATPSPTERLPDACRRLIDDPAVTDLPERLSVFGATRLSAEHQAVLAALSAHRDVHLWLTSASPRLWQSVAERLSGSTLAPGPRADDPTTDAANHRLLGYLGRDSRELQVGLSSAQTIAEDRHYPALDSGEPDSLLQILQADLAADRPLRLPAERQRLHASDRSVQFHACHGPDRQVEVLRELLVGMLAADPTLELRDIVVMCPDIETFAPLISASFGLQEGDGPVGHPGHRLRVRLADRALRQLNPLLSVLSRVLALVDSRMEASTLLDLFATAPVARKFGFTEDDLITVHDLVTRSGVRWGLDAAHRTAFGMAEFGQNTWSAGLDRLLLGVAMDEDGQQFIGTALPLDDVDSSDVDLVGRIAECIDRIATLTDGLREPRPLDQWIEACKTVIESLTAVSATDGWQTSHAYAELGRLTEVADSTIDLSLGELEALLADTFRGRPSRANFRTGTLTMCTMMPMRSIPHRVVCLLGVDDGVFPRIGATDGDDILAADPWVGDRDPRSEDRQLLLDAITAAEDRLVVVYSGADPRTGAARPPAVPIGELLDVLEQTAVAADGGSIRPQILTRHPLQPFDQANFKEFDQSELKEGALPATFGRTFSFDQAALRGARAAAKPRSDPPDRFDLTGLPTWPAEETVGLDDLVRFFNHPVKALLRSRAGLYVLGGDEQVADDIPITLDHLDIWGIGDRLLRQHLDGVDLDQLAQAEWRRGQLPPRTFGARTLDPILDTVSKLAESAQPWLTAAAGSQDINAVLNASTVVGTCAAIRGDTILSVNYSTLSAKHRLQAWLRLLAVTVTDPGRPWSAVTIGRGGRSVLGPVPAGFARTVLDDLVQLYWTGLNDPLPFSARTSAEYARICAAGKSVKTFADKLAKEWDRDRDAAYESFFGAGVTFAELSTIPSLPSEERGPLAEPSRFGTLARRVWHPLQMSEELR